jgi:hypothetical protein
MYVPHNLLQHFSLRSAKAISLRWKCPASWECVAEVTCCTVRYLEANASLFKDFVILLVPTLIYQKEQPVALSDVTYESSTE